MPKTKNPTTATPQTSSQANSSASDEIVPLDNEEKEFMEHVSKSLQQTTDAFLQKQKQELHTLLTDWKNQSLTYIVEERRKLTKRNRGRKQATEQKETSEQHPQDESQATQQQPPKQQRPRKQKQNEETHQPEGSSLKESPQTSPTVKQQPAEKRESGEKKERTKKTPTTPTTGATEESSSATTTTTKQTKKKEQPVYIHISASAQIRIPAAQTALIQEWSKTHIPEEKLFVDPYDETFESRVADSTVSVCVGLPDDADKAVQEIASATKPLAVTFSELAVWPGNEGGYGYETIALTLQPTNELYQLREAISTHCTRKSQAARKPHCIIAYVKKGFGKQLLKEQQLKIEGSCLCNEIVFVERTGNTKVFPTKQ